MQVSSKRMWGWGSDGLFSWIAFSGEAHIEEGFLTQSSLPTERP